MLDREAAGVTSGTHRAYRRRRAAALGAALAATLCLALTIAGPTDALAIPTQEPTLIKDPPGQWVGAYGPAADGAWLTWSQVNERTGRSICFAQQSSEPSIALNARTTVLCGGLDGVHLPYVSPADGRPGDLYRFNLRTGRTAPFPTAVNTPHAERHPSLSHRHLLFARYRTLANGHQVSRVLLYDQDAKQVQTLARARMDEYGYRGALVGPWVTSHQVNGDYATWRRTVTDGLRWTRSAIFLHHIPTGVTTRIPHPRGARDTAAAVSADGTVYLVRNRHGSAPDEFLKIPAGQPQEILYQFALSVSGSSPFVDDRRNGTKRIYLEMPGSDDLNQNNIYRLTDPPPA